MNVISRKLIRAFYNAKPERQQHAEAFEDWYDLARAAEWQNFQDTKGTFGQTDIAKGDAGRSATIFDVGGNKYRIVAHIDYLHQTLKIEAIMDHAEYDKNKWKKLF